MEQAGVRVKSNYSNMAEGKLWKQILQFSLPIFFASVLQQIYNMVDVWFVGNFIGSEAIAAIGGATTSFINMSINLCNGFSAAITVMIGQKYGGGKKQEVIRVIQNALVLCAGIGVLLTIVGILIAPGILRLCNVPEEVMDMAVTYLRIYFAGTIAVFLYNVESGILRAMGDSKRTLYVLGICCGINVLADAVFVVALQMGVAGAAISTVIAQTISALITLYLLVNPRSEFTFSVGTIQIDKMLLWKIVKLAVPCSVQSMLFSLANLIFQSSINGFETTIVAAVSIYNKADMMCWWVVESVGVALTTIVAQNYGADKKSRIRESLKMGLFFSVVTEICFSVLLFAGAKRFFMIFTNDTQVTEAGIEIVHAIAPFFMTYIFIEPIAGCIKGMGETLAPMIITFLGVCVLRIAWVLGAGVVAPDSFLMVLYNYPVTWSVTSVAFILYYWFRYRKKGY